LFAVSQSYQNKFRDIQIATQDTQQLYNQQSSMLTMLTQARDTRAQDPALLAEVQKLQKEARDKGLLLEELKGREQLKNQGFSMLMDDLSTSHVEGVWLTRISIAEQRIRMEGATLESSKVPQWVSKLRDSDYFSGRSFAGARMFRDDEDNLNFVISSSLVEIALNNEQSLEQLSGSRP
jgi:Tfp pilus assembly protein PilN